MIEVEILKSQLRQRLVDCLLDLVGCVTGKDDQDENLTIEPIADLLVVP